MPKNSWRSSVLVTNQENTCLSCFLPLSSNRFGILWLSRLLNSSSSQRPMTARHMAAGPPFFCFKTELDLRAVAQVIFQPVCDPTFPTPQERPYSADCHFTPRWRSAGARPPRWWARWSPARTAQGAEPGGAPLCTGTAPRTAPVRPSHTPSPPSTRARPYPCIPRSGIRPLASLLPSIPSVAAAPGLGSPRCGGARRRLPSRRGRHVGQLRARRRLLRVTAGGRQGEGDENGRKGGREAALHARTRREGRMPFACGGEAGGASPRRREWSRRRGLPARSQSGAAAVPPAAGRAAEEQQEERGGRLWSGRDRAPGVLPPPFGAAQEERAAMKTWAYSNPWKALKGDSVRRRRRQGTAPRGRTWLRPEDGPHPHGGGEGTAGRCPCPGGRGPGGRAAPRPVVPSRRQYIFIPPLFFFPFPILSWKRNPMRTEWGFYTLMMQWDSFQGCVAWSEFWMKEKDVFKDIKAYIHLHAVKSVSGSPGGISEWLLSLKCQKKQSIFPY